MLLLQQTVNEECSEENLNCEYSDANKQYNH